LCQLAQSDANLHRIDEGMASSPRPALASALPSDLGLDLARTDDLLATILRRTAGEITVRSMPAARRAIHHRLVRRRRRVRHSLGTGTLAAGLVAGLTHQLWSRTLLGPSASGVSGVPADAASPAPTDPPAAVTPQPTAPHAPVAPTSPSSWTWDPETGTDTVAADPGALYAGGAWHVYTTSATHCRPGVCATYRVPRHTSADLATPGRLAGDALPDLPAWVDRGRPEIWAPSVAHVGDRYVLWFSATAADGVTTRGTKCLGAAVATGPEGPFVALPQPLRCTPGYWAIDPYPVEAGGRWYLLWREDDAAHPTGRIVGAELAADGLALATPDAEPTTLLAGRHRWEDATPGPGIGPIENPAMARHPDTGEWLLAWSANSWTGQSYATGLARCAGPLGPCRRMSDTEPWLRTDGDAGGWGGAPFGGAGGLSFASGPGGSLHAVFHAYPGRGEHPAAVRAGWVARVEVDPYGRADRRYRIVAIDRNHSVDPSVEEV
jgi:hypothetical protein